MVTVCIFGAFVWSWLYVQLSYEYKIQNHRHVHIYVCMHIHTCACTSNTHAHFKLKAINICSCRFHNYTHPIKLAMGYLHACTLATQTASYFKSVLRISTGGLGLPDG